jgi:hypothetical protein
MGLFGNRRRVAEGGNDLFQVFVKGAHVKMNDGTGELCGFFTDRVVRAKDEKDALAKATAIMRAQLVEMGADIHLVNIMPREINRLAWCDPDRIPGQGRARPRALVHVALRLSIALLLSWSGCKKAARGRQPDAAGIPATAPSCEGITPLSDHSLIGRYIDAADAGFVCLPVDGGYRAYYRINPPVGDFPGTIPSERFGPPH